MNTPSVWQLGSLVNSEATLQISGDWRVGNEPVPDTAPLFGELSRLEGLASLRLDTRSLGDWDSSFMTFLLELQQHCRSRGGQLDLAGLPSGVVTLLDLASAVPERADAQRGETRSSWLARIGEGGRRLWLDLWALNRFTGEAAIAFAALIRGRARFRRVDLWLQFQDCGPAAVPIVTLISLLVGMILAFVAALQLALFGAQLYIADLVALGTIREMGALMTAVIMSGRSGAAFAAQIGTMNVNLEISALRVMGFAPLEFLVLPRMLALIGAMPLLYLYADLLGIFGGGLVSVAFFDVSATQYWHRTTEAVALSDLYVGLFKSLLFGILIALAGCLRGMQCGRSASAVGDAATSAVVTSIVFIVLADSLVTLVSQRLGI